MIAKLTTEQRSEFLQSYPGWQLLKEREAIRKRFEFETFQQAFGFLTQIAFYAERIGHHPELFNIYDKVMVTMTTHDAGGLSDKDVRMVQFIEDLAELSYLKQEQTG